jgi:hypothetical protein
MTSTKGQSKYTCTLIRGITHRGSLQAGKAEKPLVAKGISLTLTTREVVQLEMLISDTRVLTIGPSIKL